MKLTSESFANHQRIPQRCAFGVAHPEEHLALGENRSPQLSWSNIPDGAQSLVLLCVDTDVPSSMDDFNNEGRTIAASLPRVEFFHWVMIDIPARRGQLAEGECSNGIAAGGKSDPSGPAGSRQGINDYTGFMADNPDMRGDYYGYDGPCPPWNDTLVHHYRFRLYALSIAIVGVDGPFTGAEVLKAIKPHVITHVELTGLYSLNPDVADY